MLYISNCLITCMEPSVEKCIMNSDQGKGISGLLVHINVHIGIVQSIVFGVTLFSIEGSIYCYKVGWSPSGLLSLNDLDQASLVYVVYVKRRPYRLPRQKFVLIVF